MTLVDDQQIDCVIRRGDHDYIDLQIKAKSKKCKPGNAGIFAPLKIPNPRDKYFFLLYCERIDTYWTLPSSGMPYMGAFHLRIPIILILHDFIYAPPSVKHN